LQAVAAVLATMNGDGEGAKHWSDKFAAVAGLCIPVQMHSCGSDEVHLSTPSKNCCPE
jgi:hypothetical protein